MLMRKYYEFMTAQENVCFSLPFRMHYYFVYTYFISMDFWKLCITMYCFRFSDCCYSMELNSIKIFVWC